MRASNSSFAWQVSSKSEFITGFVILAWFSYTIVAIYSAIFNLWQIISGAQRHDMH
jgi:hypothetical protein